MIIIHLIVYTGVGSGGGGLGPLNQGVRGLGPPPPKICVRSCAYYYVHFPISCALNSLLVIKHILYSSLYDADLGDGTSGASVNGIAIQRFHHCNQVYTVCRYYHTTTRYIQYAGTV